VPIAPAGNADECLVSTSATSQWELNESIPTGKRLPSDWRTPRRFADLTLDDLFTDFPTSPGFQQLGQVEQPGIGAVEIWADTAFRNLVVFTPPHRNAVCLEPYTCPTDAVNLQAQGVDAGWQVLAPGESRTLKVQYRWRPS